MATVVPFRQEHPLGQAIGGAFTFGIEEKRRQEQWREFVLGIKEAFGRGGAAETGGADVGESSFSNQMAVFGAPAEQRQDIQAPPPQPGSLLGGFTKALGNLGGGVQRGFGALRGGIGQMFGQQQPGQQQPGGNLGGANPFAAGPGNMDPRALILQRLLGLGGFRR